MIIGEFNESYPPSMDGVGEIVYDYVHELRTMGDECYAVVAGDKHAAAYDATNDDRGVLRSIMHVIPVISPYGYTWINRDVRRKVRSIPFDIVHAHSPFMMGRFAIKTARKKGIPVVMTFHSQFRKDIKRVVRSDFITDLVMKYVIHSFEMADEVWAVSRSSADILHEYGFGGNIRIVENFCSLPLRSDSEIARLRAEGRAHLGIADDMPVLLFVGQQRREKNLDLVLASVKRLNDSGFRCMLVSVGSGPDQEKYRKYVSDSGIEDCVIFTGRIVDRALMEKIYASADLFAFPSLYDNAPLVVREAAALAVPSLLIEGATCAEGAADGVNAFLTEDDEDSYSSAIMRILSSDDLRRKAGKGAQRDIYRSRHEAVAEVREIYRDIIERYRNR